LRETAPFRGLCKQQLNGSLRMWIRRHSKEKPCAEKEMRLTDGGFCAIIYKNGEKETVEMPIKEESFRIGCGRYRQRAGVLAEAGQEISRLGTSPMIIGDDTSLAVAGEVLMESVRAACTRFEVISHNGTCNDETARAIAEKRETLGYDVIVGVGGGVIMDFAKLCAHFAHVPVVNIPTSSATCAAYTPLSVRYTPEGKTVGSLHYGYEVDAVLCDTAVMLRQPARLFLAGVFDALAKFVEIKHRYREDTDEVYPLGLDYAYVLAKYTFSQLDRDTALCLEDMKKGELTPRFENMIFATMAVTGVISGIARGSNQTALGHKFYETTRILFPEAARPYLHGEIVGIGLLLQNHVNGEEANNAFLLDLMKKYGMPSRITDVGITPTEETKQTYLAHLLKTSSMENATAKDVERLQNSLAYLWQL